MTKLSIIIPCYNCERTVEAAVASVVGQESEIPFDITMVDDGSRDRTPRILEHLRASHPEIRVVRHQSNLGGGAARNTAVANCDGEIIFCLDSDDMLGPGFLKNLTRFWLDKRCDGLGVSKSIKFNGSNINDVSYVSNFNTPGQIVPFESLLDGSDCPLLSTFLITREAFARIGGYPTAHGFDTQGMAYRFLCNGQVAYTCPDTVYYHRVNFHQSYYIREARAGRVHWNWLQILSEYLYLFRDECKAQILDYEVFPTASRATMEDVLRQEQKVRPIYVNEYREFVRLGRDGVAERLKDSPSKYDRYWLGEYALSKGRNREAFDYFVEAVKSGFDHWTIHGKLVDSALRAAGSTTSVSILVKGVRLNLDGSAETVDSLAPPLPRYQRLENWMFAQPCLNAPARMLKSSRLLLRRLLHGGGR